MMRTPNRIKVLHVLNSLARGGVEVYLMNVIRTYDRSRFQMDFCCKGKSAGEMAEEARSLGSKVLLCRMNFDQVRFIRRFVRLLKSSKYDVVNSQLQELSGPIVYAAHLAGVPIRISSYHSLSTTTGGPRLFQKIFVLKSLMSGYLLVCHKLVLKYSTAITGCSQASIDSYFPDRDPCDKRFKVLYYGTDIERFAKGDRNRAREVFNIPADSWVIGHVGSFTRPKDHRTFVKAAHEISRKIPNVKFLLVGKGYLRPEIERMVNKLGLEDKFVFAGLQKDIPLMLSAMDLMLFPSIAEGLPMVLIEAQVAGVPVVTSSLPSIKEAICEPMRKLTVEPGKYMDFAENVIELSVDTEKLENLRQAGVSFVAEQFSREAATKRLTEFYEELITSV